MKKTLPFAIVLFLILILSSCSLIQELFPSLDPIVGTWTVSKIMIPSNMDGDDSWHDVAYYSVSGQVVAKDDNTFTSSMDYGGSPVVSSGTWMNDSGVYTFITTTDGYANVVLITLSSDNKTAFASVNNGIAEQLTKE